MGEVRRTFAEVVVEFLQHQALYNPDQSRVASTARILTAALGQKSLAEIRPKDIENFIAIRRLAGVSPATCNRHRAFLSRLYNWSSDRGDFDGLSPLRKIKRFREVRSEPRVLTPEEAGRLVRAAEPRFKMAIVLALYTGGRRGELRALAPGDVDLERCLIRFRWRTTKGRKERFIPIPPRLTARLADSFALYPNREWLLHYKGGRLRGLRGGFEDARAKATLPWANWITLRHTFSAWFLTNGGSIARLQELLGHVNPLTTMIYRHFVPGHGQDVVRFIGPPKKSTHDIGEDE